MRIPTFTQRFMLLGILIAYLPPLPAQAGFTRSIMFPVDGTATYSDDFGDGRSGGRVHLGNDLMAPKHTPVIAAVDGSITFAPETEPSYGYMLVITDSEGYEYKYLHLNNDTLGTDDGNGGVEHAYAPGVRRGVTVTQGQHIGWIGDSGNAENVGSHLHFEIHTPGDVPINPYESLKAATIKGASRTTVEVPAGELVKYPDSADVYILSHEVKYLVTNEATLEAIGYRGKVITTLANDQQYRSGMPLTLAPGIIFTQNGTPLQETTPTTRYTRTVFKNRLVVGSRGPEVVELQSVLKRLGYYTHPTITGYYGTATRTAVLKFQKAYKLEQVGFIGPKTRALLNTL